MKGKKREETGDLESNLLISPRNVESRVDTDQVIRY